MGEAMAHTGTHIADLRESPMGRNLFQLESRAWGVTVMSAISSKEKTLTLPGGYVAWNSKWTEVDQQKQLPEIIERIPDTVGRVEPIKGRGWSGVSNARTCGVKNGAGDAKGS